MSSATYRLYGRPGSGSDVVRFLLEEIGTPYEFVPVGTTPAEIEAYRKLSLTDKVPALALPEGGAMFESAAICIHLAAAHPAARLAPAPGTAGHARFLQWMVYLSANLYECVRRIYYSDRYSRGGETAAAAIRQQALADFETILGVIVPVLSPYVLGKEISAADYYLYMVAGWHPDGWKALHPRWPALARHTALLAERPAVRKVESAQNL